MGQKVNPHGLRVGVIKDWDSRWYAEGNAFGDTLVEDYKIRNFLKQGLKDAGIPRIEIERDAKMVRIHIHCAKPGMVIYTDQQTYFATPDEDIVNNLLTHTEVPIE